MEFWNVLCAVISVLQDINELNQKEAVSLVIASLLDIQCFIIFPRSLYTFSRFL